MCGKFYGIIKSTTSNLMKEFYSTIGKHLKPLVINKLIKNKIKKITIGFESLHGIPYILGAINGGHIPIVAPKVDPKPYYYKKKFCSTLIQRIVHRCKVLFLGLWLWGCRKYSWLGSFPKNRSQKPCDEGQILNL